MADRIDMTIPESFHRVKRTVLLFASAIVLVSFSQSTNPSSITLLGSSVTLPKGLFVGLLLAALIYYVITFRFEADVATRLNAEVMSRGQSSYQAAIKALADELRSLGIQTHHPVRFYLETRLPAVQTFHGLYQNAGRDLTALIREKAPATGSFIPGDEWLRQPVQSAVAEYFDVPPAPLTDAHLQELLAKIGEQEVAIAEVIKKLDAAHDDMTKLNSAILGGRRISFMWLEIRATYAFAFVAVICAGIDFYRLAAAA